MNNDSTHLFLKILVVAILVAVGFQIYQVYKLKDTMKVLVGQLAVSEGIPDSSMKNAEPVQFAPSTTRTSSYWIHPSDQKHFWNPSQEIEHMKDRVNKIFQGTLDNIQNQGWVDQDFKRFDFDLNTKVQEEPDTYVLNISIPNVKEDSLQITIQGNQLQIKGINEESLEEKDARGKVIHSEQKSTTFFRSMNFPTKIDPVPVNQFFENGILHLELRKVKD